MVIMVIIIRQLTRPFTVKQLQQLLSKFGQIAENGFWIDNIKSMCIVKYSSVEEAVIARGRLHNVVWPSCSPRMLKVDYTDELRNSELKRHIEGDKRTEGKDKKDPTHETKETIDGSNAPNLRISVNVDVDQSKRQLHVSSSTREKSSKEVDKELKNRDHDRERRRRRASDSPRHVDEKRVRRSSPWRDEHRGRRPVEGQNKEPEKRLKTADELYQKTKTQPAIYFLPLTDDQVSEIYLFLWEMKLVRLYLQIC
ncbi:unnamed protein product [Dracunculus medinensis]|uniref:RRM domain-containing protein n=1 Tax=Dracunculus medinensis TaxID=318479 RepID=A0A0N4UCY2_DRAME|nr:unnamed protein product [Dracunculus medinensis]